ncbi:multiple sugar transport system ATP-binding protein [Devosia enhydra]|uniref:Multiple sugar transport system ATP-binding protein n=1 Tax=Devosia enhydra TaxID=665118 RepID=A0A1K2HZE7_9HYPH|nr:ABC transporter ATP-binding protein [Devosia enhydra]SFZ85510.1 multiple sugar transport system ATP-binding protein [Devosia enhydra]
MAFIQFDRVSKSFGATRVVLDFSLEIAEGEFVVLVGPSGCGKTTSLRMLAGLEQPTSGRILIDGVDVTQVPSKERGLAMVFQSYALYPHMSVAENIGFALSLQRLPKAEIEQRVAAAADRLDIGHLLSRKPRELSGGQRQRVAVARSIVREPRAFLFDEPLSNLDAKLRHSARVEIRTLQRQLGITTLYVTHDQVEAMTMADRIVVMDGGAIRQVGTPMDVYRNPNSVFVASFLGAPPTNCIDGEVTVSDGAARFVAPALSVPLPSGARPGRGTLGIRPESFSLSQQSGEDIRLEGRVRFVEALGAETLIDVAMEGQDGAAYLTARLPGQHDFAQGRPIGLFAAPASLRLFDADGNHAGMGR